MSQQANTTSYGVTRNHARVEGILVMPVAGDGKQPPKFIKIHDPYETESVSFGGTRETEPAIVPSYKLANRVFVSGNREANIPAIGSDENKQWMIRGGYFYILPAVQELDSDMPTGQLPYIQNGPNTIRGANFSTEILEAPPAITTIDLGTCIESP